MLGQAFVTVSTNDEYAIGGVVLGESLRRTATTRHLVALVTDDVSLYARKLLADVYDHVYLTTELCSHDDVALSLLGRPELAVTFTKIHCWRLTQYNKCVYMDSDTLVLQHCEELFERDELSAVPDTGWPDCFNSGVFVFRPSLHTYAKLVQLASAKGSFDGGDQGLLNAFFHDWRSDMSKRLPFMYNVVATTSYSYLPAYRHYSSGGVKIVHFLGQEKPWSVTWDTTSGNVKVYHQHPSDLNVPSLQMWLGLFRESVLHKLPSVVGKELEQLSTASVSHLLRRIRDGDLRTSEAPPEWRRPDPLTQEYFPVESRYVPPPLPPPPTQMCHYEPPPSHVSSRWEPPPPPPSSPRQSESEASHHYHHYEPSFSSSHHHHQGVPSECERSYQENRSWEHRSDYQSSEVTSWEHPAAAAASEQDRDDRDSTFYISDTIQEPTADPHWEALLWHSVQTPWEPPSPPATDLYFPQSDTASHVPPPAPPTFGWFSSHTGASSRSSPPRSLPPAAPVPAPPPSSYHQEATADWSGGSSSDVGRSQMTDDRPAQSSRASEMAGASEEHSDVFVDDYIEPVVESSSSPPPPETEEQSWERMRAWEDGNIDYLGRDNFDNIWKRLEDLFTRHDSESESVEPEESEDFGRTETSEVPDTSTVVTSKSGGSRKAATSIRSEDAAEADEIDSLLEEVGELTVDDVDDDLGGYPEGDFTGMRDWEEGRIDYCGRDRSDNIMKRLDLIFSGKLSLAI